MQNPTVSYRRAWPAMFLMLGIACLGGCATIPGDENPVLTERAGDRAKVVIDESAFSAPGRSAGYTVTTSDGGVQRTATVEVHSSGFIWGAGEAAKLEQYFTDALLKSGGFLVIDRSVLDDRRFAEANAGHLEDEDLASKDAKVLRPDLKLRCQLVKLDPASETKSSSGSGFFGTVFGWAYNWVAGWFGAGGSQTSRKASCEIRVSVVDYRTGETLATAKGEGYAVGSSRRTSGSGMGVGGGVLGGLVLNSGESKGPDLSLAIERATIRAVNDLIRQIPARYFRYPK